MTKILKTLPITENELADFKKKKIEKWIDTDCEKIKQQLKAFVEFIDEQVKSQEYIYIANKDVFYIPSIVGLFPNINKFDVSNYKNDYDGFSQEQLKENFNLSFSGFLGELPSTKEIDKCVNNKLIRNGSYIKLNNTNHRGLAYKGNNNQIYAYNTYRNGKWNFGQNAYSDEIWIMPIVYLSM